MRVKITRSGGFAGIVETLGELDTAASDSPLARKVEESVAECRFFELPAEVESGEVGADLFRYEITVVDGDRQHTVSFGGDGSSEPALLWKLVSLFE